MNRIYGLRWNGSRGLWMVVSELARRGVPARMRSRRIRPGRRAAALSSLGCLLLAAPTGGRNRSRLFICASHTLMAIYTKVRGCERP
jgi:hypothetical protein